MAVRQPTAANLSVVSNLLLDAATATYSKARTTSKEKITILISF